MIDSIQTLYAADMSSAPGSVGQVREAAGRLLRVAKEQDVATILVGHVTKDGAVAGPRVLEHLVDCVLQFEGDRYHAHRILRATKNRFGSTNELGVFEMTGEGLVGVPDPSELFGKTMPGEVGAAVACALEGTRPILLEIQALVAPTDLAMPRRVGTGVDPKRLAMIVAVLSRHAGVPLGSADVFVNVAGGLRIDEPGADLAIAMAIASAQKGAPVREGIAVFGEIGLTGRLRPPRSRSGGSRSAPNSASSRPSPRRGHAAARRSGSPVRAPSGTRCAPGSRSRERESPQIAIIPENHAFSRGFCYTGSRSPVSSRARRLLHGRDDLGEAGLFDVGDKVVYPHHGAGTVVKKEKREVSGQTREYLTIQILHNDMTVNVPVENAEQVGLRTVIDEDLVNTVVKALTAGESEMPKNWNRRFKHNRDKMKTGDIFELAEVVKNLSLRDHEKGLSTGEKQMFVKAKKILASELMYAKAVDEEEAAEWLEGVLAGNGEKPKKKSKAKAAAATA